MYYLFLAAVWCSQIAIIVGLFKPSLVLSAETGRPVTRWRAFRLYILVSLAFAFLAAVAQPETGEQVSIVWPVVTLFFAAIFWTNRKKIKKAMDEAEAEHAYKKSLRPKKNQGLSREIQALERIGINNRKQSIESSSVSDSYEDEVDTMRSMGDLNRPSPVVSFGRRSSPFQATVESSSTPGIYYTVDTDAITCTCPDFQSRKYRAKTNPKRLCKHLIHEMNQQGSSLAAATGLSFIHGEVCGRPVELCIKLANDWIDVRFDGERHGFNAARGYWTNKTKDLPEFNALDRWVRAQV